MLLVTDRLFVLSRLFCLTSLGRGWEPQCRLLLYSVSLLKCFPFCRSEICCCFFPIFIEIFNKEKNNTQKQLVEKQKGN